MQDEDVEAMRDQKETARGDARAGAALRAGGACVHAGRTGDHDGGGDARTAGL